MITNERLAQFIDDRYIYKFSHGPNLVQTKEQAIRNGINCVSLAHLALRELFDVTLPATLMCSELHRDRNYFKELDVEEERRTGDLEWFGIEDPSIVPSDFVPHYEDGELVNWRDYPIKHVAIHTGEESVDGALLLHSTSITGTNSIWPHSIFKKYRRYKKSYGVTRLRD